MIEPLPHRVTQADIARELGIGQKTVSRALGAPGYVSGEMRERVQAAAQRLGYRRNSSAATMRTGRFHNVLLLQGMLPAASNLTQELLYGLHDRLARREVALTLTRFDDEALRSEGFLPRTLRELAADGLLIKYDINVPDQLADHLERHGLPAVWINSKRRFDAVHPDDHAAGVLAVEHLVALGHRRIAYLDRGHRDNPVFHYSRADRLAGYRAAMAAAGLVPCAWLDAQDLVDRLRASDATAVVGYGGHDLLAAMRAAVELGRQVPHELSLVTAAGAPVDLGLAATVVLASDEDLGAAAADLLLERIRHPGRALPTRTIPYRLVPGASTAAPADRA